MDRRNRLAMMAAAVLILVASGTVLATRGPGRSEEPAQLTASQGAQPEDDEASSGDGLAHAGERLSAKGIAFDDAALADLASRYGIGGAVRLLAWADATGTPVDELAAMRDGDGTAGSAMGWGQIAKDLGVSPGIGSIMGNGGGHGRDDAPGQQKAPGADEESGE